MARSGLCVGGYGTGRRAILKWIHSAFRDGHGGAQLRHLVEKLQRKLSVKVQPKDKGGSGTLEIRYASLSELDRVLAAILGE